MQPSDQPGFTIHENVAPVIVNKAGTGWSWRLRRVIGEVKRIAQIFWAHLRCNLYLLHPKHFLECAFVSYNHQNRTNLICTLKGTPKIDLEKKTIDLGTIGKIFYSERS
jgi:hypothetical protein